MFRPDVCSDALGKHCGLTNAKPGNPAYDDESLVESTCTYDVTMIHLVSYENSNKTQRCGKYYRKKKYVVGFNLQITEFALLL